MTPSDKDRLADNEWLELGVIVSAHGIRGQFKVKPFTANPVDVASYGPVRFANGQVVTLQAISVAKGVVLCASPSVTDRNAAAALKGTSFSVHRSMLPPADEDEVYHADLLGMNVYDSKGLFRGHIVGLFDFGAGDIAEIRLPDSQKTEMLPFYAPFLKHVDSDAGKVIIDDATD